MTSGNGLTIAYTAFNKPATITRGTTSISFDHDPGHQRYAQTGASGITVYIGGGVLAERFAGSGGIVQWSNYLIAGGRLVGVHIERSDETTATRYFHTDHLGSISVITDENAVVLERLSYDAWGRRRHADGTPDPAGSITSEASRGFTSHEQLDSVGLVHMNGRVYDPLLARFGTPDPMTENPFSTQGWNRYSYVGNSPLNFTDPSGYCFLGCFWKPIFKAVGNFLRRFWGAILQVAATALICGPAAPACAAIVAGVTTAFVVGVTSGNLGLALRAGFISMVTAFIAQNVIADITGGGTLANAGGQGSWGPMMGLHGPIPAPPGIFDAWKGDAAFFGVLGKEGVAASASVAAAVTGGASAVAGAGASFAAGGADFIQNLLLGGVGAATSYLHLAQNQRSCPGYGRPCLSPYGASPNPSIKSQLPTIQLPPPFIRPGRPGGPAHRATVERRADELVGQGHTITGGGNRLPERSVITPEGKRRFPDISTRDGAGRPYHENVGRSIRSGQPISRERDALRNIERATGTRPGYTPYDR